MAGNSMGGAKAAKTNIRRHGKNFYAVIGSRGGKAGHTGGFFANRDLASIAGSRGGKRSKRGHRFIGIDPSGAPVYQRTI
jgi:uncharacterized protein